MNTQKLFGLIAPACLLLGLAPAAVAQKFDCAMSVVQGGTGLISAQFTSSFDKASAPRMAVTVINLDDGTTVATVGTPAFNEEEDAPNSIEVTLAAPLDASKVYVLYVKGLTFGGDPPRQPLQTNILHASPGKQCGNPGQPEAPEGREDANVYVAGALSTSSGSGLHGTIDLKLKRNLHTTDTTREELPKVIHDVGLLFDLKASGDPGADPDSLNFGVDWFMSIWRRPSAPARARAKALRQAARAGAESGAGSGGPFNYVFMDLSPKIESERDFDNTNAVLDHRFRFGLRRPWKKSWAPVFSPFVGQEIGKNINSPLPATEHSALYRIKAGTLLNLFFEPNREGLQKIEIDAEYTRRWPLRRELSFKEGEDGLELLEISKRPRDYARVNMNFMFREDFGTTLGYEYGELPPSFKLVDHKFKIGLVYKTK